MKTFLKILKKTILLIVSGGIPGFILRSVLILSVLFVIGPKLHSGLNSNVLKIELLILLVILIEILVLKASTLKVNKQLSKKDKEQSGSNQFTKNFFQYKLKYIIKNKPCYLFLRTFKVSIGDVLSNQNYSQINIEKLQNNNIQIFNNYHQTIISYNINEFESLIEGRIKFEEQRYG